MLLTVFVRVRERFGRMGVCRLRSRDQQILASLKIRLAFCIDRLLMDGNKAIFEITRVCFCVCARLNYY